MGEVNLMDWLGDHAWALWLSLAFLLAVAEIASLDLVLIMLAVGAAGTAGYFGVFVKNSFTSYSNEQLDLLEREIAVELEQRRANPARKPRPTEALAEPRQVETVPRSAVAPELGMLDDLLAREGQQPAARRAGEDSDAS